MNVKRKIIAAAGISALATAAAVSMPDLELVGHVMPIMKLGAASVMVLAAISIYLEGQLSDGEKTLLMNGFLLAILLPSFYAAGAFVHESQTSWSNGEVHWHADFEILVDDAGDLKELDLVDPEKFCGDSGHESSYMCKMNDRTGSTKYHEHNDDRIHVEGVFKDREDATLAAFFEQFYGELTNDRLVVPTNQGEREYVETDTRSIKILVHQGSGPARRWCLVGDRVKRDDVCRSHGELAGSPDRYVVSPYTQGPHIDDIFIVYDSETAQEALQDVREDNEYRGHGLTKEGSGYSG